MKASLEVISTPDEAALSWYFGRGLSVYEQSTFGFMIARLERDSCGSSTCGTCNGAGILGNGGFAVSNVCRTCSGSMRVAGGRDWCADCCGFGKTEDYKYQVNNGGWCPDCKGTGVFEWRRRAKCSVCGGGKRQIATKDGKKWFSVTAECANCSNCLGTGEELITARHIQNEDEEPSAEADEATLTRFAIISRRVSQVFNQSPALAVALSVYYGDVGQRWAMTDQGRIFSLYHMTGPGKKLAKWGEKAGKAAELGLTAQERIGTQAALEREQPKEERRALLAAAGEQAVALYKRAAKAWNNQSSQRERRVNDRLSESLLRLGYESLSRRIGSDGDR